jgi:hypothetical protein
MLNDKAIQALRPEADRPGTNLLAGAVVEAQASPL